MELITGSQVQTHGSTGHPAATQSCEICVFQVLCDARRFVERLREICAAAGIYEEGNGSEAVNIGAKAGMEAHCLNRENLRRLKAPQCHNMLAIILLEI